MSVQDDSVTDPWQAPGGPQPYAPPLDSYGPPPAPYGAAPSAYGRPGPYAYVQPEPRLRSVTGLGSALIVLSSVYTGLLLLEALLAPGAARAAERARDAGLDPASAVSAYHGVAALSLPVVLGLWVIASIWLSFARSNACAMFPGCVRRGAAWAWLGWVVPFAVYFVPKQIVDDVLSLDGSVAPDVSTARWWSGWVVLNILASIANALRQGGHPTLMWLTAIAAMAALWPWIRVVRAVGVGSPR